MKKRLLQLFLFIALSVATYSQNATYPLKYIACISQTGENAPTENRVYENTLGAHTWTYYDEGFYVITFTETSFAKNQIWLFCTYLPDADPNNNESLIGIEWGPYPSSIRINTKGNQGFDDAYIEIRIYAPLQ